MSTAFNLTSAIQVFPCPNCRETINTTAQTCPFCGTAIDHAAAEHSAAKTARISRAVSDASYIRIMLGLLIPFFLLIFVPLLNLIGVVGFWFLKIAIPVMTVRWWVLYGRIRTTDPDFPKARRTALIVAAVWLVVFALTLPGHH